MKSFLIKILTILIVFFIYDKLFFIIILISPKYENDKRLEHILNGDLEKDIIVVGSSRGARDIVASQIQSKTYLTAYNLCYTGSNVEYHEFIIRTYLMYNPAPKLALYVLDDYSEFLNDEILVYRLDRLYPLVKHSYIRNELVKQGEKNWLLSYISVLHQINLRNFELKRKSISPTDTILQCGSMPISFQRSGRRWEYLTNERQYPINKEISNKLISFNNIIDLCDKNNIQLILVIPPSYFALSKSFKDRITEITENKIPVYVYNLNDSIYLNKDYYYDEFHLSKKGATIFTDEIIQYLMNNNTIIKPGFNTN